MKEHSPISTQAAILIGALIIAVSNLMGSGIIKLQGLATTQTPTTQVAQVGNVGNVSPAPSGSVVVQGVTAGNLPTLGDKNAKVLVVEWADYQCPFCKQWFDSVENQFKKDYVDTGKVQFAFRDFAFLGQESNDAANAARCANEQGKYWDYHDYLYSHQGSENSGTFSKDNLKKFAASLNLNSDQFNSCVDSNKYAKDVQAGKKAGTNGTPTVYINGTQLVGAQPYSSYQQAIDAALAGK